MTSALAELNAARCARLMPPASPRSHREIARTMTLPDGDRAGARWDIDIEPIQVVFIRSLEDPRYSRYSLATPSQRGKSLMAIALPLIRTLTELRANVAYVMPNLEKLGQAWEGKVRPLFIGCGYGGWLPEKGPGSRGGKPPSLTLRDPVTHARVGTLYFMAASGGGKETSVASVSAFLVAKDEADDFESEAKLMLADKRNEGYRGLGKSIETSTLNEVKGRTAHPILQCIAQGTRTRLWFQCPHCAGRGDHAGFQVLSFDHLVYTGTTKAEAKASARYRCQQCASLWTEEDRQRALMAYREVHDGQDINPAGDVVGDQKPGNHYSLLANDLEWSRSDLGRLAEDHFIAAEALRERGEHKLMRLFYMKRRCESYTADIEEMELGKELTWQDLLSRSQSCQWGPSIATNDKGEQEGYLYSRHVADPPQEAQWCVAFVDVQDNRVYPVVVAGNRDGTTWDTAWSYQYARLDHKPWDRGELHRLLDDVDLWLHRVVGVLPLVSIGVDVGYATEHIMAWLVGKRGTPWRACKGTGENHKIQPGDIDGIIWRRDNLYHIHTENTRTLVQSAYRRPNGQLGSAHIPNGLNNTASDRAYLAHLVAEMLVIDPKTRKQRLRQGPGRWDWLDARRGCYALNRLHLSTITRPPRKPIKYGVVGPSFV